MQCCNALFSKEMITIDDYSDGEKRYPEREIWNDKRENSRKRVSYGRLRLYCVSEMI